MRHVLALGRALHPERDAAEILGSSAVTRSCIDRTQSMETRFLSTGLAVTAGEIDVIRKSSIFIAGTSAVPGLS